MGSGRYREITNSWMNWCICVFACAHVEFFEVGNISTYLITYHYSLFAIMLMKKLDTIYLYDMLSVLLPKLWCRFVSKLLCICCIRSHIVCMCY